MGIFHKIQGRKSKVHLLTVRDEYFLGLKSDNVAVPISRDCLGGIHPRPCDPVYLYNSNRLDSDIGQWGEDD
jgi:hypothetical protein